MSSRRAATIHRRMGRSSFPTYNEHDSSGLLLESLFDSCDRAGGAEVVIVDDNSEEGRGCRRRMGEGTQGRARDHRAGSWVPRIGGPEASTSRRRDIVA